MKRICLLLLVLIALFTIPDVALAQDGITVISSSTSSAFPYTITFNLEAESESEITNIDLEYRINKVSLIPVSSRVDVDFTPGLRAEASWTWNLLETGGLPPGAEFDYWWLIEDASGHRIETSPAPVKFDDHRHDWNRLAGDQVTIYWYQGDEPFAQELMDAAGEALQRLASDIGVSLEQAVSIYIYASSQDLLDALVFPYEWTGGIAFPDFGIIAIGIPAYNLAWGKRAMAHELAHLVVYQAVFGPYGDIPVWLDEGLAVYTEGGLSSDRRSSLEEAISNDELISVRSLSSSFPTDPDEARLSYAESYSVVVFLLDNYGQDKMLQLLDVFREGSGYDGALIEVYGFDMDGLNELWRASLGLGPQPTPAPKPGGGLLECDTSDEGLEEGGLAGFLVLILLVVAIFAVYRYMRRTRQR